MFVTFFPILTIWYFSPILFRIKYYLIVSKNFDSGIFDSDILWISRVPDT